MRGSRDGGTSVNLTQFLDSKRHFDVFDVCVCTLQPSVCCFYFSSSLTILDDVLKKRGRIFHLFALLCVFVEKEVAV